MMMDCDGMMSGMGGVIMMLTAGLVWLLVIVALVLAIAALLKYLRSPADDELSAGRMTGAGERDRRDRP